MTTTATLSAILAIFLLFPFIAQPAAPSGPRFRNSLGMEFVRIEPGAFTMGHDGSRLPDDILNAVEPDGARKVWLPEGGDSDERPAHPVRISRPFYLAVHEVTNDEYEQFNRLHAFDRGKLGFSIEGDEAVVFVSWHEAKAFCDWLSKKEGLPYRLPTEAEWEYAARAGTATLFSTGNGLPAGFVRNATNSWYPAPQRSGGRAEVIPLHVGRTPPNAWGLFDVHGNVEEWVHDWYGPYIAGEQTDPVGRVSGHFKVTRGGSHSTFPFYLRSANRMGTLAEDKSWYIGFRVMIGDMPATAPLPAVPPEPYQQNVKQERLKRQGRTSGAFFRGPVPFVRIPPGAVDPLFTRHNHSPSIAECPNGDLLAIWYTTVTERGRELAVAASRLRRGSSEWENASLFWDAPDRNDHTPVLWYDGDRTLHHFQGFSVAATWGPLAVFARTSTDNGVTWSTPNVILPEHRVRQQLIPAPVKTREGYIILPADAGPGGAAGSALIVSRDGGKSWADAGGTIAGIHTGFVQLRDGRLMAFGRGNSIDGKMPVSLSTDMGNTWEYAASPFPPIVGGQRLIFRRLKEGPLLFVSFANTPVTLTDASGAARDVTGMFAALSYDEGKTWPKQRLVSDDGPDREFPALDGQKFVLGRSRAEPRGYLAAIQASDGMIHLITSRNHYSFNLQWLETPAPAR